MVAGVVEGLRSITTIAVSGALPSRRARSSDQRVVVFVPRWARGPPLGSLAAVSSKNDIRFPSCCASAWLRRRLVSGRSAW